MDDKSQLGFGIKSLKFSMTYSAPRQLLDSIMKSEVVRILGAIVCVILALVFGIMFIIGSVDLLKSDKSTKNVAAIESQNEMAEENEGHTITEGHE